MVLINVDTYSYIYAVDTYSYNLVFLKTKKFIKFSGFP